MDGLRAQISSNVALVRDRSTHPGEEMDIIVSLNNIGYNAWVVIKILGDDSEPQAIIKAATNASALGALEDLLGTTAEMLNAKCGNLFEEFVAQSSTMFGTNGFVLDRILDQVLPPQEQGDDTSAAGA